MPYKNPDDRKAYYRRKRDEETPEQRAKRMAVGSEYRKKNADKIKAARKKQYQENKAERNAKTLARRKARAQANPEEHKVREKAKREAIKARRAADPEFNQHVLLKRQEMRKRKQESDPAAWKASKRREKLRSNGWTEESWDQAVLKQGGACAICGKLDKLVSDHNHATDQKRGLLCNFCNTGLGLFRDDPSILDKAAVYLRKFLGA